MSFSFINSCAPAPPLVKGHPKLYHKKSRYGCQRCKARRVKCDEGHPTCRQCQRHSVQCVYDRYEWQCCSSEDGTESLEPPESKSRRLLELRLLNHFVSSAGSTLLVSHDAMLNEIWVKTVPRLALNNNALLYSIHSLSAAHLARINSQDTEALEAHQKYLSLTVREHQSDFNNLSNANADEVCMTTVVLRLCAFVVLQERHLATSYTPPMDWIRVTSGGHNVVQAAWKYIEDYEQSPIAQLRKRLPPAVVNDKDKLAEIERRGLAHLLRGREEIAADPWPTEMEQAYESAICYLGQIVKLIADNELPEDICRRMIIFPMNVQSGFFTLVEYKRPRALLVLAHYFALVAKFKQVWWIGDAGQREVHAIQAYLPDAWQGLMAWPLQTLKEKPIPLTA